MLDIHANLYIGAPVLLVHGMGDWLEYQLGHLLFGPTVCQSPEAVLVHSRDISYLFPLEGLIDLP